MKTQQRWTVLICSLAVSAAMLCGEFGSSAAHRQKGKGMNTTRISVDHVRLTTNKAFGDVTKAFEQQLGRFDPDVYKALAEGGGAEKAKAKIEAMAGPSGFMLFATHDHGALLRLAGQKRKAIQYVVGNPLWVGDLAILYPCTFPLAGGRVTRGLLKVARDPADNDLLANEARALRLLAAHERHADYAPYVPSLVESPLYSDRERAALAWTESVTLVSEGHVPDEVFAQAMARDYLSRRDSSKDAKAADLLRWLRRESPERLRRADVTAGISSGPPQEGAAP